ncbi:hypothetical protein ACVWZA_004138 [Sphingomonas sp. UYAg733]
MRWMLRSMCAAVALTGTAFAQTAGTPRDIAVPGNPIIADGSYYSADPAPIVADDTLYVIAGHDEAGSRDGGFVMNEWQMFATRGAASGKWRHYPAFLRPEQIFGWAEPGHAYAAQIVRGQDKRFYLYAPVAIKETPTYKDNDRSVIGVAVADHITGPWKDAHPAGPIVGPLTPGAEKMQSIDPTVIIDDDGRVYLYWGTFGQLRGVELERDMVTARGPVVKVDTLKGFFEAPWLMKRKRVYYMIYAGNAAGPASGCTPAVYHACQAYGTATSPLGPWTYRGVFLKPVSSTTSHGGVVAFRGKWYLVYHTADAAGGGHFRRSVAIDELKWDDTVTPARILPLSPTMRPRPALPPTRNVAPTAIASASNEPIPLQYWIKALNDGIVRDAPLPPDMWASWTPNNPPRQWLQYRWIKPVTVNESRIWFWADAAAGANAGVAPPRSWRIDYWDGGSWKPVGHPSGYPNAAGSYQTVRFEPVSTTAIRATFEASGTDQSYAALAVQEWEVLRPASANLARGLRY